MGCVPSSAKTDPVVAEGIIPEQKRPEPAPIPVSSTVVEKKEEHIDDEVVRPVEVRKFESKYKLKASLGKGRYGTVKVCVDLATGHEYAVKIIDGRAMKSESTINDEVYKLRKVGKHPNVVQFYDFFKDENNMFYIVMELCQGGDLFSRIVEDGSYTEQRAATLLRQLASALVYIHSLGITHRDLKVRLLHGFLVSDCRQSLRTSCYPARVLMLASRLWTLDCPRWLRTRTC
jgi:serine/threonine protein kinase